MKDFLNLIMLDADDGTGGAGGSAGTGQEEQKPEGDEQKEQNAEEKKYTDADVDKILEAKFAKWEKKKEKEISEAKKLENMNAEERAEHSEKKAQEALEKLARYEMAGTARGILAEQNVTISDNLLGVLIDTDAEQTKANIENFVDLFNKAVTAEVEKRLKGHTPPAGTGQAKMSKEDILNIKDSVARQKAIAENIKLFE